MTTVADHTEDFVTVAGGQVHLMRGGAGPAVLVLHHDIGNPGWIPFYTALAQRASVHVPSHPGYDRSERPVWMRNVRDLAIVHQWLINDLGLEQVDVVGLGFGGWVAAELATMAPRSVRRLVLVGAMGLLPADGEIFDQAIVSTPDYVRTGVHNPDVIARVFGADLDTDLLEQWEINREMTFRIAWKPYMYSQTLPHLLGAVRASTLVIWGDHDRIVPRSCGERYAQLIPNARFTTIANAGHLVDLEQPDALAGAINAFLAE